MSVSIPQESALIKANIHINMLGISFACSQCSSCAQQMALNEDHCGVRGQNETAEPKREILMTENPQAARIPPPLCLYSFFCLSWLLTTSLEDYAMVVYHVFFSSSILVSLHVHTNSQGTPSIKTELLELTATPCKQFVFSSCSPAQPALRLVRPAGPLRTHMCRSSVAQPGSPPALS